MNPPSPEPRAHRRRPRRRRAVAASLVAGLLLVAGCGGDDDDATQAEPATSAEAPPAVSEPAASDAAESVAASESTIAATSTTEAPAAEETAAPDDSQSCFGITVGDLVAVVGNSATAAYPDLGPPLSDYDSVTCSASLSVPAGGDFTESMYTQIRIQIFDPTMHQLNGVPTTYDELKANNVECCSVTEVDGLGEAAFIWTNLDVDYRRRTAVLFRQGDRVGAIYAEVATDSGGGYPGWDTAQPLIHEWLVELATTLAATGVDQLDLPAAPPPLAAPTTAAPTPTVAG